jgi:hypothetical protein
LINIVRGRDDTIYSSVCSSLGEEMIGQMETIDTT